jgi:hypothetical protein
VILWGPALVNVDDEAPLIIGWKKPYQYGKARPEPVQMTPSLVPAGGLVVLMALMGVGIFGVAMIGWRPLLEVMK